MSTKERMISAIIQELNIRKDELPLVNTIYLGGGTPSLLSQSELSSVFESIHRHYSIAPEVEITLEANPDDITSEVLFHWASIGINRLSIGCQTFDDNTLLTLNRIHRSNTSLESFALAREKGFSNISIDLMFGLPGQTPSLWSKDLEIACALKPEHISAYGLTIEKETVFGNLFNKGLLTIPNENDQADYYEQMMHTLAANGYDQYEISNFCLPGFYSKHNSSYWEQEHYLGIGPSAHSFNGEHRMWNPSNNMSYIQTIEKNKAAYSYETLSETDRAHEYILTSLRTSKGVNTHKLLSHFNYPVKKLEETILLLQKNNWIELTNDQIVLTQSGKLLADEITLKFFLY